MLFTCWDFGPGLKKKHTQRAEQEQKLFLSILFSHLWPTFFATPWIHWKDQKKCVFSLGLITFLNSFNIFFAFSWNKLKNKDTYYFWYCFFQSSAPKRSKKDDHETQIRTPSEFTRALIWQKSTSAISGNQGFLLWGAQSMPWLSGRGKKQPVAWHGGTG